MEAKNYLPLLIQDSRTEYTQSVDGLERCLRIDEPKDGSYLQFALVDKPRLGVYLRNDSDQNEKYSSAIDLQIPRFETKIIEFTELPQKVRWFTDYGLPDLLMIRVEQNIATISVDDRYSVAEIVSCRLSVQLRTPPLIE